MQNLKRNVFGVDASGALAEAVKEQRRSIARSLRSLDRQHAKAEAEEHRVFSELKSQAVSGRVDRLQAKQLILLRRRREAILRCKAQLGAADIQVQQQQATQELHRHFNGCSKLLSLVNKTVDLQTMQLAVKGFTRESQKLGLMDEMLNEVLEDGTAQMEDEGETEDEVLQEILECANADIERQFLDPVRCVAPRVKVISQRQQQTDPQQTTQQQQHQYRNNRQQQPGLGRKQHHMLLHALSTNRRPSASRWLTKDEAELAEKLDQRLGSLLK